jgi:hypothetical protein
MSHSDRLSSAAGAADAGFSLIETMGALTLLLIILSGLMGMDAVATRMTENYGHLAARTAEYAQDKMEQLLGLAWGDVTSDTAVFPATSSGGTGLAVGGSSDPSAPVTGYVDYLDQKGDLVTGAGGGAPASWYYKRVWSVTSPVTNLKQVTVTVTVSYGYAGNAPVSSTVTALKSYPF